MIQTTVRDSDYCSRHAGASGLVCIILVWYSREEGKEASNIAWEGGRNLKKRTQREGGNIRGERIKKKVGRVKFTRPCR